MCEEDGAIQCSSLPCINAMKEPYCPDNKYPYEYQYSWTSPFNYRLCRKDSCLSESQSCDGQCVSGRRFCPATGDCLTDDQPCGGVCPEKRDKETGKKIDLFLCGDQCKEKERYVFCGGKCWNKDKMLWSFAANSLFKDNVDLDSLLGDLLSRTCHGECITPDQPCDGVCLDGRMECDGKCWYFKDYYNEGSKIDGNEARRKPCGNVTCDMFGIKCKEDNVCINHSHVCDGKKDCNDGSDEDEQFCTSCGKSKSGAEMILSKKNKRSDDPDLSWRYHCYNEAFNNECLDENHSTPIRFVCGDRCLAEGDFCLIDNTCWTDKQYSHHCNDGKCIKDKNVCDGVKDCADGSDETNCKGCRHGKWLCGKEYQCRDHPCEVKTEL